MYPAAPPPAPQGSAQTGLPRASMWAIGVSALGGVVLGSLPWPRPVWSPSSAWMVADVSPQLWAVIGGIAVACVGIAVALTRRTADLGAGHVESRAWLGLVVLAAAALMWNAIYAAALSTIDFGAPIPIFDWLFTFVPAVLAGLLFRRHDRRARQAAALGTGIVTVPLFALSWALLSSVGPWVAAVAAALVPTVVLGVAPLAGGVALAAAFGASSSAREPWSRPRP